VRRRALERLRSIVRAHPDATVVIVSHQNTIRWIVAEALGYGNSRAGLIRGLAPGEVIAIDAHLDDDRLVLAAPTTLEGGDPELLPARGSV
jgi:broad specificity phosphatase PhoE